MSKPEQEDTESNENQKGGSKVTAASLMLQAESEAAKGPREAFKAWVKNKKIERGEIERRLVLIDTEIKHAASDFDKGLWVAPKNQKPDVQDNK